MKKIVRFSMVVMSVMLFAGCGKDEPTEEKTDDEIREDVNETLTEMISEATATEAPTEETEELPDDYLTKVIENDSWDENYFVKFGKWDMDQREENGTEFIDWVVLERNDHDVLLISRQKVIWMKYNNSEEPVSWENCPVRSFLNGEFFDEAFTSKEQDMIEETVHDDGTVDKAYLLSVDEFCKYYETGTGTFAGTAHYQHTNGFYKQDFDDVDFALRQEEESGEFPYVNEWAVQSFQTSKSHKGEDVVYYHPVDYKITARPVIRVTF